MKFRNAILKIAASQGEKTYLLVPDQANSFGELYVDFQCVEEDSAFRYTVFLHPKEDLVVLDLALEFNCENAKHFFANGYQSWSESRLLPVQDEIPRLRKIARPFMGYYGDEHIEAVPRGRDFLHSWTYSYVVDTGGEKTFMGSLAENTGFTLFVLDKKNNSILVRKDLQGLHLSHSFPAMDFLIGQGSAVARIFHLPAGKRAANVRKLGWTSWYRHFTNISEANILKDLESVAGSDLPFQYFQIDDGWQTAVGDWLSVAQTFPNGMAPLASAIRAHGLTPGLWLAPFVASAKSDLAKKHPYWLLKNAKGRAIRAGWNPYWGGWFYALDFYNPEVRDYLSGVFHVVLERWGFELLKLDFLFAVCLQPPKGKTRGQVMHDAMEFLRKQLGDRILLACGLPLGSAVGQADICRIGGDIHLAWEHRMLAFLRHRERVSTLTALRSVLGRWQWNGGAFVSDPDVFLLRKNEQHLSPVQQHTILIINILLGGVLFTSDDVATYSPEQRSELDAALDWQGSRILAVKMTVPDVYRIDFENAGVPFSAYCNLTGENVSATTIKNDRIALRPFETLVLEVREDT